MATVDSPERSEPAPPHTHRPAALTRSQDNRMIAGVCGGLARRTDVDPIVYRITCGVLAFLVVGFLLYGAAWLLLPHEGAETTRLDRLLRRRVDGPAALAVLAGILIAGGLFWPPMGYSPTPTALIVIACLAAYTAHRRGVDIFATLRAVPSRLLSPPLPAAQGPADPSPGQPPDAGVPPDTGQDTWRPPEMVPPPPPDYAAGPPPGYTAGPPPGYAPYFTATPPGPSPKRRDGPLLFLLVFAASAVVAGTLAALGFTGVLPVDTQLIVAAAVLTIGLGGLVGARYGRGRPLIGAGLVLSLVLVASTVIINPLGHIPLGAGMGEVTWRPTAATLEGEQRTAGRGESRQHTESYQLAAGEATLVLTGLPRDRYRFAVHLGAGELRVRVPREAKVIVHADVNLGGVIVEGERLASGRDLDITRTLPAQGRQQGTVMELHLIVGAGEVSVNRVSP